MEQDGAPHGGGETADGRGAGAPSLLDAEHLSTQLSELLAELVRTPEVEAAGEWSPGLAAGDVVGRFRVVRPIGRGGMGEVFEATDLDLGRPVALKVVRPLTQARARGEEWLRREAEAVARLNHPNIVTLHDLGRAPSGPYLVFELLGGRSLSERLREGPLPLREALRLAVEVTRALVHAHEQGVIHRDLKPGNVHLGPDGRAKVLDFGLAALLGRAGGGQGGTPAYMAPEQWRGEPGDARTDLFALGVLLHHALTGTLPFKVEGGRSEVERPGEPPELPPRRAPPRLRALIRRLLARRPDDRPESAREVRDELSAIEARELGRGRRRLLASLGLVAAAALGVAAWLVAARPPPEPMGVVVAGLQGDPGEPALLAAPGLLAAALEPSRRLRVVTPGRLVATARAAGLPAEGALTEARARELARLAEAPVVLLPEVRRVGDGWVLRVRAVSSEAGTLVAEAEAPVARPAAMAGAVDQVADLLRDRLGEARGDRALRAPVARAVTASPEAARLYYEGVACLGDLSRPSRERVGRCAASFERALAADPGFALAQLRLALLRFLRGGTGEEAKPSLEAALQARSRLPPREAELALALQDRLERRPDAALARLGGLLARDPDDWDALDLASTIELEEGRWARAVPLLRKLDGLAAAADDQVAELVGCLGRLGRDADLRALLEDLARRAPSPARVRARALAHVWLGEAARAVEIARAALADGETTEVQPLRSALLLAGEPVEAEALARADVARRPDDPYQRYALALALGAQGRFAEALRALDEAARLSPRERLGEVLSVQAQLAAGRGEAAATWRLAARAAAISGEDDAAQLAVVLELVGDPAHASELARRLPPGSVLAGEHEALAAARGGDGPGALARLSALEARDPAPVGGLPPAFLLAWVADRIGDHAAALAAVERLERIPLQSYAFAWYWPEALVIAARAELASGNRAAARDRLDRLARLWARADRGLPLLAEARALRRVL